MSKFIMISIVLVTIIRPVLGSKDPSAARGLKKMVRWMTYFVAAWALSLAYLYGRLF
ncbi:MAG: hypothetical protein IPG17_21165 [Sandaracinaceae bacterium]|nr:hypothetical protein [Sandaracinaceae bacterium]MBK8410150.1 hypothetical protein [Sandaracinaceae bacterium]